MGDFGGDLGENLSRTDLSTYLEQKDPLNSTDLLWGRSRKQQKSR